MATAVQWRGTDRVLLGLLCAVQFVLIVDVVVVNIAVPSIQADLAVSGSFLQLTSVAYTVVFGSLLIVAGRAGTCSGRRRVLLLGLTVFTVMSLLCGLAQADGGCSPRVPVRAWVRRWCRRTRWRCWWDLRRGELRNRALGIWAAVSSAGAIAGQVLVVVTEFIGWRGSS